MLASLNARKNLKDKMLEMNSYPSGGTTRTLPVEDSNRKNVDDRVRIFLIVALFTKLTEGVSSRNLRVLNGGTVRRQIWRYKQRVFLG